MIVVPKAVQLDSKSNVALSFIQLTFGSLSEDDNQPQRILSAFMAISSFGNIVVMTFTAARGTAIQVHWEYKDILLTQWTSQTRDCKRRDFTMGKILWAKQELVLRSHLNMDSERQALLHQPALPLASQAALARPSRTLPRNSIRCTLLALVFHRYYDSCHTSP
jgi:hypothetical protein